MSLRSAFGRAREACGSPKFGAEGLASIVVGSMDPFSRRVGSASEAMMKYIATGKNRRDWAAGAVNASTQSSRFRRGYGTVDAC